MKKYLDLIPISILLYLIFSFILANFNVFEWSVISRFLFTLLLLEIFYKVDDHTYEHKTIKIVWSSLIKSTKNIYEGIKSWYKKVFNL